MYSENSKENYMPHKYDFYIVQEVVYFVKLIESVILLFVMFQLIDILRILLCNANKYIR